MGSPPDGLMAGLWDELEVAVIITAYDSGEILFVNKRVSGDLHQPLPALRGQNYRDVFWPEFRSVYEELAQRCQNGKEHTKTFYWGSRNMWEQVSTKRIAWDGQDAILMSITNITELMRAMNRYENLAYFDPLLNLPNGKKLEADITELTSTEKVTLIYFSIDHFEDFNELYGWDAGDALLKLIRDWMLKSEWNNAQLYYIGSGFASLGRNVTLDDTVKRSKEIIRRFQNPWMFQAAGNTLSRFLTIRPGIVHGKYIKNEMRNLILRTIRSPQSAEGYTIYDEKTDREVRGELALRDSLINCVSNNMAGFDVHYQPIVCAKTGKWIGMEALCRWTTPSGEQVPPAVFIRIAEHLGLVGQIDAWVCREAMAYCVSSGLDKKDFLLHINFSPTQRLDDEYIGRLERMLVRTGFPPGRLSLEVTESTKMAFDDESLDGIQKLKEMGIVLSLDDFGTGYSSLENLMKLSAFALKVDKTFVDSIEHDEYRQYLLRVLVDIAHHLDMKVIVEGVETRAQAEVLQQFGPDFFQGYLFSRPLPVQEMNGKIGNFI